MLGWGDSYWVGVVLSALTMGALGCRTIAEPSSSARRATVAPLAYEHIRSPQEMPEDFQWRQVVRVACGESPTRAFDAVLEKSGERMTLLGLNPLGTVTFVAEADGTDVRFENRGGERLPFEGRHLIRDVQRVFFPWLSDPVRNGWRTGRFGDEVVRERLVNGRVVERRFERRGKLQAKIQFLEPVVALKPSPRVTLENMRFGYRLDIQTLLP